MNERTYKIKQLGGSYRLVQAPSRQRALVHVAEGMFSVKPASLSDLAEAKDEGIEVEYVNANEMIEHSESPGN